LGNASFLGRLAMEAPSVLKIDDGGLPKARGALVGCGLLMKMGGNDWCKAGPAKLDRTSCGMEKSLSLNGFR
jgi:hypothetical protein